MSAFPTPPRSSSSSSSSRVSSRKTTPLPLAVPTNSSPLSQHVLSPRRRSRGGRHISRSDPGHCGLYPLTEADEDHGLDLANSRCPSWYSNAPSSPGPSESVDRSSVVYTPHGDGDGDDDDLFNDYNLSPMSDSFHHSEIEMSVPKMPSPRRSMPRRSHSLEDAQRQLRSPIRTPTTSVVRPPPRVSAATTSPYPSSPMRLSSVPLLPALPILAPCEQRAGPPSPPSPSTPLTPTTPGVMLQDGIAVNLVSALHDLLTTCGEFDSFRDDDDDDMFADADDDNSIPYPVPGQFDDVVSPKPWQQLVNPVPTVMAAPRTPPSKVNPSFVEELIRAPRQSRGPREPLALGFDADHSLLNAMASDARADRLAAEADAFEDYTLSSISSLPSLSSSSSLSSASSASLTSIASLTSGMGMTHFTGPVTPPQATSSRKPCVSSRRILRSPLPPMWTA